MGQIMGKCSRQQRAFVENSLIKCGVFYLFYLFIYFWLRWVFVAAQAFSSCCKLARLRCGARASHCGGFPVAEHGL